MAAHIEESVNTLLFALTSMNVINKAEVNEVESDQALLKRQAREIKELRSKLGSSGCAP